MSVEQEPKKDSKELLHSPNNKEIDSINEKLREEINSKAERAENIKPNADTLQVRVEQLAVSGKEMNPTENNVNKQHPVLVNKQLKDMAYSRTMTRVRKHLSIPSRLFSKVVHSKALDKPSELIGNTVARPSGMLGGALIACIGSSLLLWITKHFGYSYNYLSAILLFVLGTILGLSIEAIWKTLKRGR